MKKVLFILLAMTLVVAIVPGVALAHPKGIGDGIVDGAVLNGQHYNLNIIGVKDPKNANMDGNGGHVIFVAIDGKSKINLVEGPECAVLDKNATDADGATLQLPDPGIDPYVVPDEEGEEIWPADANTITNYSIFVRALGSPKNSPSANITTCADVLESKLADFLEKEDIRVLNELADMGGVVSIESTGALMREKGQSIFTNQTAALLTIVLKVEILVDDVVVDTVYVRVPIFDDILQNAYWEYDNNNLKLLQVRIYRVGTDVSTADDPEAWDLLPLP
jgi:hypothetical protein